MDIFSEIKEIIVKEFAVDDETVVPEANIDLEV